MHEQPIVKKTNAEYLEKRKRAMVAGWSKPSFAASAAHTQSSSKPPFA